MVKVLLIDDDPDLLNIASEFLKSENSQFKITTFLSAQEAMPLIQGRHFDVVVCDYQLPGMDGLQLLEKLRRSGNFVPFIMFTGKGREEVVIQALNLDADYYLQKSSDPKSLYAELAHIIVKLATQKQLEQIILDSEERFRALADQSLTGIIILQDGKITYANKALAMLIGYSLGEIQAWATEEFANAIHAEDRPFVMQLYRERESGKARAIHQYDIRVVAKTGEVKWLSVHTQPIKLPGKPAIAATALDITNHKLLETTLRESEEKFRSIIEQSMDGIALIDEQGLIVEWNQAQEEIFGLKRAEVIGCPLWKVQFQVNLEENKSPELYKKMEAAMKDFIRTGEASWLNKLQEFTIQHPNGEQRIVQQLPFRIQTSKGFLTCSITRNLTDYKQIAEFVRKKSEELREFVQAMDHDSYDRLSAIEEHTAIFGNLGKKDTL
ncbi:MAG: PAS domain S-box protein [Candidatus Hodarchaeota archaeon]